MDGVQSEHSFRGECNNAFAAVESFNGAKCLITLDTKRKAVRERTKLEQTAFTHIQSNKTVYYTIPARELYGRRVGSSVLHKLFCCLGA